MRCIIAGGRDFVPTKGDEALIKRLVKKHGITTVISGCARGADTFGEYMAGKLGLALRRYKAEWDLYGRSAGHRRNQVMAQNADAVILFPGGRGTNDMRTRAEATGLKILYDGGTQE